LWVLFAFVDTISDNKSKNKYFTLALSFTFLSHLGRYLARRLDFALCVSVHHGENTQLFRRRKVAVQYVPLHPVRRDRDSAVSVVTRVRAERSGVRVPAGAKRFSRLQKKAHFGSVTHPVSSPLDTRGILCRGKAADPLG
jgi:hypothetical protein